MFLENFRKYWISGKFTTLPTTSVHFPSGNISFARCDTCTLSGWISKKVCVSDHYMSGHYRKGFQLQKSRVKVIARQNALLQGNLHFNGLILRGTLHWLPMSQRITFIIEWMSFDCSRGQSTAVMCTLLYTVTSSLSHACGPPGLAAAVSACADQQTSTRSAKCRH